MGTKQCPDLGFWWIHVAKLEKWKGKRKIFLIIDFMLVPCDLHIYMYKTASLKVREKWKLLLTVSFVN